MVFYFMVYRWQLKNSLLYFKKSFDRIQLESRVFDFLVNGFINERSLFDFLWNGYQEISFCNSQKEFTPEANFIFLNFDFELLLLSNLVKKSFRENFQFQLLWFFVELLLLVFYKEIWGKFFFEWWKIYFENFLQIKILFWNIKNLLWRNLEGRPYQFPVSK